MVFILDSSIPYKSVWASRGKHTRAEPIQMLYEQGHNSHVGNFPKLEEEMTTWTNESDWSPNRMDALVWVFTELMIEEDIDYDYS